MIIIDISLLINITSTDILMVEHSLHVCQEVQTVERKISNWLLLKISFLVHNI